ncbi:MAG: class I SAM-dependent methyltransferase [Gemmata sp.]
MTTVLPRNYWRDDRCAKAFWSQHELPAYRELMADTTAWVNPAPGERWLDLGCGAGRLCAALWQKSGGTLAEVTGLDVAALNERSFAKLRATLAPTPGDRLRFEAVDFSAGLPWAGENRFDGAVSGLAIQYAESYSDAEGRWTTAAYDGLLADVRRVLKPGARFVFSVNVPEPSWGRVGWNAMGGLWSAKRKLRFLGKLYGMWRYGGWLKREARQGRFHYLPADVITAKLEAVGFRDVEHKLSFARQALLFRATKH